MADPFSIASGVAGIVSLGITICSGLDTYFSAIKNQDDDLKHALEILSLLRSYVELIRPNASTLSHRYAQSTGLVIRALGSCESELRALKELVDNLNKIDGSSDVARKWERSKSVITYPFQRKKLTQVQDQLLKATGTLGTVVQPLILCDELPCFNTSANVDRNVGVGVSDDLGAFRSAVQDNHLVTTAFLTRLETKIEMIEGSNQQTKARLTEISAEVEEQKALASSSQMLAKATSLMVSEKLDAIEKRPWPGPQSHSIGTSQQNAIPRYLRNAMIESKHIQESTTATCPCQGQNGGTGRQPLTMYRFPGGLTMSHQVVSKGGHQPGCCFYKKSTKTTITYTGFRYLVSKVLSFSLQCDYQCGGCLTTHSLRTYNVRKTSRAFDTFRYPVERTGIFPAQKHIEELKVAYTSGGASPFDVDEYGMNAAHMCINFYHYITLSPHSSTRLENLVGLRMILLFLQQVGVEIHVGTNHESSMLEYVFCKKQQYHTLGTVYDVLANCESQFDLELDHKRARYRTYRGFKYSFNYQLQCRADVAEGLGYRNLYLAVLKRDEAKLKELIKNPKFAEYVDEEDFMGQNILHFCLSWEIGLRLLLQQEATHHLVNQPDTNGTTPLADALILTGRSYHNTCGVELGSDCDCSTAIELLLETDCPVAVDLLDGWDVLGGWDACRASPKAMTVLLEHLGQRRERLHRLAMRYLPEEELQDLGVSRNQLPDTSAPAIWEKIQSLHQSGVVRVLHKGLKPWSGSKQVDRSQKGIFHLLRHVREAEVAFNLGFKSTDTPDKDGLTPIMFSTPWDFAKREDIFPYADWLIKKGARLDRCANSLGISAAHNLAHHLGEWVSFTSLDGRRHVQPSPIIVPVLSVLAYNTMQSRFPCPCTTEELSRPLHLFVVSSLSQTRDYERWAPEYYFDCNVYYKTALVVYLVCLLRDIASDVDTTYLAKSIIRVLTMKALRIKHLPWYHECFTYPEEKVQKIKEEREWDERLDEDRILIEELDELTQEFEQEFANQNLSIEDFLQLHWRPRIRQVQREHKQALDESQRQQLRQIGVVLDGEREKDVDSEDEDSEDEDSEDEDSEDFEDEDFEDEDSGDEDSGDEDARGDIRDREASE